MFHTNSLRQIICLNTQCCGRIAMLNIAKLFSFSARIVLVLGRFLLTANDIADNVVIFRDHAKFIYPPWSIFCAFPGIGLQKVSSFRILLNLIILQLATRTGFKRLVDNNCDSSYQQGFWHLWRWVFIHHLNCQLAVKKARGVLLLI